ncbi:MAG: cbb3-type cytochrome c oxidase subunit I [Planctomycetes bacterium]|nr:cbb3-type cytochrome c oxidase subunit I [Planctomycetota bacterium]
MSGGEVIKTASSEGAPENYLTASRGLKSWLITLDHKRIGVMYLIAVCFSLLLGGAFVLILRLELLSPDQIIPLSETNSFLGDYNQFYNKMFTLHGAVMVFMFVIPAIPAALGNFILPLQLGAKDLALPRINLLSFYLYVLGALFFVGVLVLGGLDTGWTLYPPYSMGRDLSFKLLFAYSAVFIMGFSSILTGLNFITTIHRLPPKGLGIRAIPLFLWALYATSIIQVLATPVVGLTVGLSAIEHIFHIGIFLPEFGGDPVLYQHFFWFYSHPAVYIMVLPALGIQSELIATFSRKHIFGYKAIAWSSVAIAGIGFLVWGHHMVVAGQSPTAGIIFSFLTFWVAVPSAIKVFNWVATLYKGNIDLKSPMIYALSFIYLFGVGGLTGLFLASIATNVHLHDTYWVVAHFHMVMVGTVLTAFLGGLHYWWPKISGRMFNEKFAKIGAIGVFIGFNLAFMPQFVAGTRGMPRRYANYSDEFTIFQQLSTVGAFVLGFSVVFQFGYLLHSFFKGKPAPANPWGAAGWEWQTTSPPHHHNFTSKPIVMNAYDFENWEEVAPGDWKLRQACIDKGASLVSNDQH